MKQLFTLFFLCGTFSTFAQSLANEQLESFAKNVVIEEANQYGEDFQMGSVVVMEQATGNVKCLMNVSRNDNGDWQVDREYSHNVKSGHHRAVLGLAVLEAGVNLSDIFYSTGTYIDPESMIQIHDTNYKHGGYGRIQLWKAIDVSNVCMYEAAEIVFCKDMASFYINMKKTGILFSDDNPLETEEYIREKFSDHPWDVSGVMALRDWTTPLQMCMWINAIANKGRMVSARLDETDEPNIIYEHIGVADEYIDSLKYALRLAATEGLSQRANSLLTTVWGITDVSEPTSEGIKYASFVGFIPGYSIVVDIAKRGNPTGRIIPSRIARKVIDYIAQKMMGKTNEQSIASAYYKPYIRTHLPKGVD